MSHALTVAGLFIDSWRDQSPQTKPGEMNLPDGGIPIGQLRSASDDAPTTPRLMSLIALGVIKWRSR